MDFRRDSEDPAAGRGAIGEAHLGGQRASRDPPGIHFLLGDQGPTKNFNEASGWAAPEIAASGADWSPGFLTEVKTAIARIREPPGFSLVLVNAKESRAKLQTKH